MKNSQPLVKPHTLYNTRRYQNWETKMGAPDGLSARKQVMAVELITKLTAESTACLRMIPTLA